MCPTAEFLDTNAAELVAIVFSTLPVYRDAASRQAVVGFLREAIAASDVFLKAFAAALIRCDPAKRSNQVQTSCPVCTSTHGHVFHQMVAPMISMGDGANQVCWTLWFLLVQDCIVLLSWNDLLLRQLRLPAAAKAAARVVASQAGLLDCLVDHARWPSIVNAAGGILRDKPALLDDYVAVARSGETGAICQREWQPSTLLTGAPARKAAS